MAKATSPKYVSVRDASQLFCEITQTSRKPHRSLLYRLLEKGSIRGVRSGGRVLIEAQSLKEHLKARPIWPKNYQTPSEPTAGNAAAARLRSIGTDSEDVNR